MDLPKEFERTMQMVDCNRRLDASRIATLEAENKILKHKMKYNTAYLILMACVCAGLIIAVICGLVP